MNRASSGPKSSALYTMRAARVSLASLFLLILPLSSACAYQQRSNAVPAKKSPQPSKVTEQATERSLIAAVGAAANHLVQFPSPEVEFIVGPQLKSASPLNPVSWFDSNALTKGIELGEAFPALPPGGTELSGKVNVERGSKSVAGVGTRFRVDFPGAANNYYVIITDGAGIKRSYYLASVQDNTHLTLTVAWEQETSRGRQISNMTGDAADAYVNLNYYDQALCQYINYYRTGDERYLAYARKIADSWWRSSFIGGGTFPVENSLAPRNISMAGLMLRALDGRPEMWPWITQYTRSLFDIWVGSRVNYPGLYYGARDPGYMLLHAANLARVHPDAAVRQDLRAKVLNGAVNYYARVQLPDGSWRWGAEGSWIGDAMQPFHVGLLLEGMIAVHRLTGDERVKASIIKGATALYQIGYNPKAWRATYYQVGGKWADGTNCEKGCGAAAGAFPPADRSQVAEARQLNATNIHALGYAYFLTKDVKFKKWGDDMFDSTFNGADSFRGLANFRAKEYAESYRSSGRYLAWRLAWSSVPPSAQQHVGAVIAPSPSVGEGAKTASARELISASLQQALRLSSSGALSESQLQALLDEIDGAYKAVFDQTDRFLNPTDVLGELKVARDHARAALLITKSQEGGGVEQSRLRLGWVAARLKRAADRMQFRVVQ